MSKRPTFNDLIDNMRRAYVDLTIVTQGGDKTAIEEATQEATGAHHLLTRALRRAGIPLEQIAP